MSFFFQNCLYFSLNMKSVKVHSLSDSNRKIEVYSKIRRQKENERENGKLFTTHFDFNFNSSHIV